MISNRISDDIPSEMKSLNMVYPIIMHSAVLTQNKALQAS